MSEQQHPFVSVLTPVYNGEAFLTECIESVLAQTYKNFEYIIVNNRSKDRTLEIAQSYARNDSRVRVHENETFVPVIKNHNIAFCLMSGKAKYCKVVSADDAIFPDCISQMVRLAESEPSAGFVGCYQQSGGMVRWQGFPYPTNLIPGRDVCRKVLLGGEYGFGFGTPTSLLYRADLVRKNGEFYPNSSAEADTSACFKHLKDSDYGFVYQILCYERTHEQTQTTKSKELNRYASSFVRDIIEYGQFYLSKDEHERVLKANLERYYEFLAASIIGAKGKEFWDYHRDRLKGLGYPLRPSKLITVGMLKALREALNPGQAVKKFRRRLPR